MLRRVYAAAAVTFALMLPISFEANTSPLDPVSVSIQAAGLCAQGVCVCGCIQTGNPVDLCQCGGQNQFGWKCNFGCGASGTGRECSPD